MLSSRESQNKWELALTFGTVYGLAEAQAMLEVLNDWAPTSASRVEQFEQEFARYEEARFALATSSWVTAAHLVAIVLDLQPGDEIIVPALTFPATANIFVREGAKIVFAESDSRTFNLDPSRLEEKITPRTRAIVPVHMCGQVCDMEPILAIARRHHGLIVIQDAAHATGAAYHGKKVGQLGDFAVYSFQQYKNMSTLGEGGMVVCNDADLVERMRKIRAHGGGETIGINGRMTDIQGAVGAIQLERLESFNDTRRRLAYYLSERLTEIDGIEPPYEMPDVKHVYHLYNTLVDSDALGMSRDEFRRRLREEQGVITSVQYHPTVNCLPVYQAMGYSPGLCPVAEATAERIVTLPLSPRFTEADIDQLLEHICRVVRR